MYILCVYTFMVRTCITIFTLENSGNNSASLELQYCNLADLVSLLLLCSQISPAILHNCVLKVINTE